MKQRLFLPLLLIALGYLLFTNGEVKVIAAGIAIFLVGMFLLEEGFRLFAGGALQRVLQRSTDTITKALFSGFLATSIVQSSSLISVIAISFLSAEMIALTQAVGIIFGSNLGTTTTAWIVAGFGLKVKIAQFAMPMLVLGVVMRFSSLKGYKGFGSILIGLGFVFLGIGYMKEGFDSMKDSIDLAGIATPGITGLLTFIGAGIAATVLIQSSSATMAIVITALASGHIPYESAMAMAIGANVGTTVTAIVGSIASNTNGKRLAGAHFVFNMVTAAIAIIALPWLVLAVDSLSDIFDIDTEDYVLKLALFHTLFNLIGILAVTPFTSRMVAWLKRLIGEEPVRRGKAKYLDKNAIAMSQAATVAIYKETEHLYDVTLEAVLHGLLLHRHDVLSSKDLRKVVSKETGGVQIDVDGFYHKRVKGLYSDIIEYATLAVSEMNEEQTQRIYELKLANRNIIEVFKNVREIHKNIVAYMNHPNPDIAKEYNFIRMRIAEVVRRIEKMRKHPDDLEVLTDIEMQRSEVKMLDMIENGHIDDLIRASKIDSKMASSLINDSAFAYIVATKMLETATILWIKDKDIRDMELEEEVKT